MDQNKTRTLLKRLQNLSVQLEAICDEIDRLDSLIQFRIRQNTLTGNAKRYKFTGDVREIKAKRAEVYREGIKARAKLDRCLGKIVHQQQSGSG